MIVCSKCGAEAQEKENSCAVCSVLFSVTACPYKRRKITGYPPTPIISGPDPETGDEVIRVYAPGAQSEMRLRDNETIKLSVEGTGGVGRSGEPRVMKTFRQKLKQKGVLVSFEAGQDNYGEDGKLRVGDKTFTFQVVTAPHATEFWRKAKTVSATVEIDLARAADWLMTAISKKEQKIKNLNQRAETVLAMDAQHAAFLAAKPVLNAYIAEFGDPSSKLGFASVWVIGPITKYCCRIGYGIL